MKGSSYQQVTEPSTFVGLVRSHASQKPDQIVYTFLLDGEEKTARLSWSDLDVRARAIGAQLQSLNLAGCRALLLYPAGLDFVTAFLGCIYANVVAVPAQPPHSSRSQRKLNALIQDSGPQVVLTSSAFQHRVNRWLSLLDTSPDLPSFVTDIMESDLALTWQMPAIHDDAPAFLQYTSGSTGSPKGVIVTHRNLLENQKMIQTAFGQTERSVIVSWLPQYHDMGLIGNLLHTLFIGARCILLSPMSFLQNPLRWLQCISRYRATASGGPNFAYELCVRKLRSEAVKSLDLSSWEIAFNGSETVRLDTIERFSKAFAASGFRREAFNPCYGLAEATLLVSGGRSSSASTVVHQRADAISARGEYNGDVASCGEILGNTKVVIVDPHTHKQCLSGDIGEVWISGPGVAAGYWERSKETEQVFSASLVETGEGPFLRTGDLGYVNVRELFITGRLKELIIIRGRNWYPQDIELTVEKSDASLPVRGGAAFSVEIEGEEQLVVVHEVEWHKEMDLSRVAAAARRALAEEHQLRLYEIVFIRAGTIPRTTSGKTQRLRCRELYLSGELRAIGPDTVAVSDDDSNLSLSREAVLNVPAAQRVACVESHLKGLVAETLRVSISRVQSEESLISYGLDSLTAADLKQRLEDELEISLSFSDLLGGKTIADTAQQILQQLESGKMSDTITSFLPAPETEHQFLSHGQKALWFLNRLAPELSAYNLAAAARLRGRLNVAAFREAFEQVVMRHSMLRAAFVVQDGTPLQTFKPQVEIPFAIVDASDWSDAFLHEHLSEESNHPFDLERDWLIRVTLFSRAAEEHVVLLTLHHIIADFRSLEVLFEELASLYRMSAKGVDGTMILEPRRAEFRDYVERQDRLIKSIAGEQHFDFWRRQLNGKLPELDLPTVKPRPTALDHAGASVTTSISAAVVKQIRALAQGHGATPYMVLLAAFYVLLNRYTGQEDIVVGSPVNGRSAPEFANLIGYLVNQLPLRADLSGNPSFLQLLARVRLLVLAGFEHQEFPFSLLAQRLQPSRTASSPIFQAMFVMQQSSRAQTRGLAAFALGQDGGRLKLDDLDVESLRIEQRTSQFEISLMVAETEDGLGATLQFNTGLFDAAWALRLLGHYSTLLESILTNPERDIATLSMLTDAEKHQLQIEWNETRRDYSSQTLLHEMFEVQAERTPDAIALVADEERLTYQQLNVRANQLAHYLKSFGVGPESTVGVFMNRSPRMLVALLATLKAGAAYVALDASHPAERIAFVLEDARVPLLLTEHELVKRLPPHDSIVISLDLDWPRIGGESVENPEGSAAPENLAYVIYTSGSTGRPKGVSIEHRSATTMVQWAGEVFGSELDGVLASTSICFDLSVFELFVPLSYGCKVVLAENVLELPNLPYADEITLINTVPSAISVLVNNRMLPGSLRTVNLAGESLSGLLVEQIYESSTAQQVLNLYGPSEDTTYSTWTRISKGSRRSPPIGRPVANTQVYLVDRQMQQVPIGVTGELCLGGAGLARGYLSRPELTAERFIPNPFSETPGERLYRTGDLARYLANGEIEFLGRLDQQIKLRGFRIEPGEIQAALQQHQAVEEVVVTSVPHAEGERRLVAYVVFHSEERTTIADLKRFAREKLPDYMIPAAFVRLASMPLNTNGKVNHKALPPPTWRSLSTEASAVAPQTRVQEMLASIWIELLGLNEVGIHDNFFELGGHSLLAARLVARVQKAFNVDLPLRGVFESPTLKDMADRLEALCRADLTQLIEPIPSVGRDQPLPLSFAQQRLWFLQQLDPIAPTYNVPIAVHLQGPLNLAALENSITETVRRHEALRTNFVVADSQPLQIVAPAEAVRLSVTDLSGRSYSDKQVTVTRVAIDEGRKAFDLAAGPLFRVSLLKTEPDDHVLLITIHHAICDEWSLRILLRELAARYESILTGRPFLLPELPIQYADYAVWQRKLPADLLDQHLAYWTTQLGGFEALELPATKPQNKLESFRGKTISRSFNEDLLTQIKDLARRQEATLFITFLAAFKVLLHRYTGQSDIVVSTPVATRTQPELENLIGCFINLIALRTEISCRLTFAQYLSRVREVLLAGFAHQDLPFELVIKELQLQRTLRHNPLFQVMFAFQNEPLDLSLPDLSLDVLSFDYGVSKCHLTLFVEIKESGFTVSFEYSSDRFERTTITRMLDHYANLLERICVDPQRAVSAFPILDEMEYSQQLGDWNSTHADYPREKCLHELFAEQVELSPEALAVVCGEEELRYRELNERANQVARYLWRYGVRPEARVGILLERSAAQVWGMLGVLKAGAAYVPLDVMNPEARVREQLRDGGVEMVLTEQRWAKQLASAGVKVICVDGAEGVELQQESKEALAVPVTAENLAYVIYTSGSTGKPKGVMVSHRALVNHSFAIADRYQLKPSDRVLQFASLSFDVAAEEIFPPLLNGCSIFLRPDDADSPSDLMRYVTAQRLTVMNLPASYWQEWTTDLSHDSLPTTLRLLVVGSERLLTESLMRWRRMIGDRVRILNAYGATESTITNTIYEPPGVPEETNTGSVSIGRPIANTQVYVLDAQLNPLPVGVAGDLYLSGDGLARGYLNEPGLTAEKFVANPYSEERGARMYRTGDRARYLAQGDLEFLGRRDEQVKVRGYRIELGEIESALQQHPQVRQVVAVAQEQAGGEKRVVAYLAAVQGEAIAVSEVRSFLAARLPEYMIPSAFITLEALPLTASGKVDRRELTSRKLSVVEPPAAPVVWHSAVEEILAGIWADVIGIPQVGANDSFIDLGGHSLLSTKIISRVRQAFQVEVSLTDLFESPTVRGMAQIVGRALKTSQALITPPIPPINENGPAPLSSSQQRLWFLDQLQPGSSAYNLSAAIRLRGRLDVPTLHKSLNEIICRHEALRTSFAAVDGIPVQVVSSELHFSLDEIDLTGLPPVETEDHVQQLLSSHAQCAFNLQVGPLIRALLMREDDESHVFALTMHHIIIDAWSLTNFTREFATLYEAFSHGQGSPLPKLAIQYTDYSAWEQGRLQSEVLKSQRGLLEKSVERIESTPTAYRSPATGAANLSWSDSEFFTL